MTIIIFIISFLITPLLSSINMSIISFSIFPVLISLIILGTRLKLNNLIIYSIISGVLYDVLFSSVYLNILLFPIISILIYYLFNELKYNIINTIIITIFIIFLYLNITYVILNICNVNTISYSYFLSKLLFIYIFNILYLFILTTFINLFKIKKHIK